MLSISTDVSIVAAAASFCGAAASWFGIVWQARQAKKAEDRKAAAHLKGVAGAILGELEAYLTLLDIPVNRDGYLAMANSPDMRKLMAAISRLPETHPVFDRCADQIGVLPGDLPREVSKLYNYVTSIRLLIAGLSDPRLEYVPDNIVQDRIRFIVKGFDEGLDLFNEVAPILRRISRDI